MTIPRRPVNAALLGVALSIGCTVTGDAGALTTGGATEEPTTSATDVSESSTSGSGDELSSGTGDKLDLGMPDLPLGECVSVEQMSTVAEGPSDILIVVDHSISSMELVNPALQNFSALIGDANIEDAHVVLVAGYPSQGGGGCIDVPPLGFNGCPDDDNNPPIYRHIDEEIQASTLFSQLLATSDQWLPSIRDGAWKHIWVISSADASMSTMDFTEALIALDAGFERLTFHAMVPAVAGESCGSLLPGTEAGEAGAYAAFTMSTGGVFEPLCDYNVKELFNALTDTIQEVALSCSYEIPPPPEGQVFEKGRVNVDYDDGMGLETIGYVESVSDCSGVGNGWYYDDEIDPAEILMCPQTCARFSNPVEASIEIRFGCATIPAA